MICGSLSVRMPPYRRRRAVGDGTLDLVADLIAASTIARLSTLLAPRPTEWPGFQERENSASEPAICSGCPRPSPRSAGSRRPCRGSWSPSQMALPAVAAEPTFRFQEVSAPGLHKIR